MTDDPRYDLVLSGGRIIDPARGVDTVADLAVVERRAASGSVVAEYVGTWLRHRCGCRGQVPSALPVGDA